MEETKTLIYDGSFNGFLTAVFVGFEEKRKILKYYGILCKKDLSLDT